jgi:putative tryptophan/tyrosine transport system substrate-binding protein
MRRRDFITVVGGIAAWPLATRAQQPPVIGLLHGGSQEGYASASASAFRQALSETGYIEGKNVTIDYRFANAQYDLLPALAADLVRRNVTVLVAVTPLAALAAKHATTSIPIVFDVGSDPIRDKIVESLNGPNGNITGTTVFSNLLSTKRFELLHQLVPTAKLFAVLLNPRMQMPSSTLMKLKKRRTVSVCNLFFLELPPQTKSIELSQISRMITPMRFSLPPIRSLQNNAGRLLNWRCVI